MRIVYTVYYKFKTFCDSFYKNISHVISPTGNNPIKIALSSAKSNVMHFKLQDISVVDTRVCGNKFMRIFYSALQ